MFKKTFIGAIVAAGSLMSLVPTAANAQYTAIVRTAPPAPVYEAAPPPREGFVWAPGHHEWRNGQYVWIRGHWLPERQGFAYREPRWVERNGQWQFIAGDWERRGPYGDRDRDGIPNRYDRDNRQAYNRYGPNGDLDRDGIANRDDRDRDGDGVPNHRDRYPDNRTRW